MPKPRIPIGTLGTIGFRETSSGRVHARTRYRDWDGRLRQVHATGASRTAAERALKARLAERSLVQPTFTCAPPSRPGDLHGVPPGLKRLRRGAARRYADHMRFDRITINPARMRGLPCIRDTRVTVSAVLGQLAAGRTVEDVLDDYPYLERADILAALEYAAAAVEEREVPLPAAG